MSQINRFKLLLPVVLACFGTPASFAQFTGEFALPASATYNSTQSFTNWSLNVALTNGSTGSLNSGSLPTSFLLSSTGSAGFGGAGQGTSTVIFSHVAQA